ncbi:MAG: alpha-ketoglutarate-dependent dioxygenase AlkB [Hyphomicrobiales bacterium]|nr:alpha-ketoglutarate-dependent dioxygenase AlkB [Hyphomicrobiales bacterium]
MNAPSRRRVRPSSLSGEADLFGGPSALPEGFRYHPDLLSGDEEEALAGELAALPFKPFDFHGYQAKRQVVGFGFRYDYDRRAVVEAQPLPSFLEPLRAKIARSFDRPADAFRQALINEYRPGAGIGWHRDKAQFDEVVAVSLLSPCVFRFRRRSGETWDRRSLTVEPRSAYLLSGPSRAIWEHSIPAVDRHRYSITFRTLVPQTPADAAPLSDERALVASPSPGASRRAN